MSHREAPETPVCSSRSCDQPAAGVGPFSGLSLCQSHLDRDVQMVEKRKDKLLKKLQMVMDSEHRAALRAEQSSLAAEVQQVIDMFDAVQEKLQQWRERAVSRVQAVHDSVAGRLRDAAEAEECSKEVSLARDAGDMRKVMELTAATESWLDEAEKRRLDFERSQLELCNRQKRQDKDQVRGAKLRSVGDVAAGVQQLQFMIDRHMADVMQQCWLDEGDASAAPPPVCRSVASINDLPSHPMFLAPCTNTAGFAGDASRRVIRSESGAEDCVPLPQPCLFVSFRPSTVEHLLVTSLDGAVRLRFYCNLNLRELITGLHCDSRRQQLFIYKKDVVTVTDLSGQVIREIKSSSLGQPPFIISGIDGNADKVFVLGNRVRKIAAIGKDSGDTEFVLDLANLRHVVNLYTLCVHGSKLLLVDDEGGRVLRVCAVSGQLIGCFPTMRTGLVKFEGPCDLTVDSRGLLFVREYNGHSVRVLTSDGSVVQTLGTAGQSGSDDRTFSNPVGLAVIEDGELRRLAVADGNERLRLFELL